MKTLLDYANKTDDNLVFIKLIPETDAERDLLNKNDNTDTIESFYHQAIYDKLGDDYSLLKVVDQSQWPYAAQVIVQKVVGLGN